MVWEKLLDTRLDVLCTGAILSCNAGHPYQERIDIMLFDNMEADRGVGLICTTGYYSGRIMVQLPRESMHEGKNLSVEWLVDNWNHWVRPDTDINEIFVCAEGYKAFCKGI